MTEEDDARVRALLADLGGETMPPEVAARLDATLADLVAEREASDTEPRETETDTEAEVVPLRARWLPKVAAAAVVLAVLGGLGVATGAFRAWQDAGGGGSSSSADSATSSTTDAGGSSAEKAPTAAAPAAALTRAGFVREVRRLLRTDTVAAPPEGQGLRTAPTSCPGPRTTDGSSTLPITFDGRPAVLVVHPLGGGVPGGTVPVEAWSCDGTTRLAKADLSP